jgi:hypothetical protein
MASLTDYGEVEDGDDDEDDGDDAVMMVEEFRGRPRSYSTSFLPSSTASAADMYHDADDEDEGEDGHGHGLLRRPRGKKGGGQERDGRCGVFCHAPECVYFFQPSHYLFAYYRAQPFLYIIY